MRESPVAGIYDQPVDRESAYEILSARAAWLEDAKAQEEKSRAEAKAHKQAETEAKRLLAEQRREEKRLAREKANADTFGSLLNNVKRQAIRTVGNTVATQASKAIFGNSLMGKVSGSILRGVLGNLMGGKK